MIAITGSTSGFLSGNLLRHLPGSKSIPRDTRRVRNDLINWLQTESPTHLIHCAGCADVRWCMDHPETAYEANTVDTIRLVEALDFMERPPILLYIATDKVFGQQEHAQIPASYQPLNAYDASKVAAEVIVWDYLQRHAGALLRFPNFFGKDDPHEERLIPSVLRAIRNKDNEFVVRTRGDSTRQYIFMPDVLAIIDKAIAEPTMTLWGKMHFGSPHIKSVTQVVRDLSALSGHQMVLREQMQAGEASKLSISNENPFDIVYTDWLSALSRLV